MTSQRWDDFMTLAFQCGEWDIDAFAEALPARTMSKWEHWFRRRPQGQYHNDQMLAGVASTLCASQGANLPPSAFMFYEQQEESQEELNAQVNSVLHLIPRAKPLPLIKEADDAQHRGSSNESDLRCEPIPVRHAESDQREQGADGVD